MCGYSTPYCPGYSVIAAVNVDDVTVCFSGRDRVQRRDRDNSRRSQTMGTSVIQSKVAAPDSASNPPDTRVPGKEHIATPEQSIWVEKGRIHNEELHSLHRSPNIVVIKSTRLRQQSM